MQTKDRSPGRMAGSESDIAANDCTVTVDLHDKYGFLVRPIEVLLSRNAAQMIHDADAHYVLVYEGTLEAGFETLQRIELVDVRWRL